MKSLFNLLQFEWEHLGNKLDFWSSIANKPSFIWYGMGHGNIYISNFHKNIWMKNIFFVGAINSKNEVGNKRGYMIIALFKHAFLKTEHRQKLTKCKLSCRRPYIHHSFGCMRAVIRLHRNIGGYCPSIEYNLKFVKN